MKYAPCANWPRLREEQRLLTAVASAEKTALLTEIFELRFRDEQLGRALASGSVIDQVRGMLMALVPVPARGLPVLGKLMRTHAWRAYERLDAVHWARLASAVTFTSFVALFPLITVAAAIGAKLLSDDQLGKLQDKIAAQAPGLSGLPDLDGLVAHAGSAGLIAGALLLVIGINWVGACVAAYVQWGRKKQDPGNLFLLKFQDSVVLVGLGAVGLIATDSAMLANSAVGRAVDKAGYRGRDGTGPAVLRRPGHRPVVDFCCSSTCSPGCRGCIPTDVRS